MDVVDYVPEKAGVGGSIPSLATSHPKKLAPSGTIRSVRIQAALFRVSSVLA